MTGKETTETQYKKISGSWERYFSRLLNHGRRGQITREELIQVLTRQDGKCALSGIPLTCLLENGKKFTTNASIDRIVAGQEYSINNVQLVCSALNSFRNDTDLDEFIWFCQKVTEHALSKKRCSQLQKRVREISFPPGADSQPYSTDDSKATS